VKKCIPNGYEHSSVRADEAGALQIVFCHLIWDLYRQWKSKTASRVVKDNGADGKQSWYEIGKKMNKIERIA
jgi:hypothetical protein